MGSGLLISDTIFSQALESVEESMVKLESLLQELHVSSSSSEKENLRAACSELERIRKLKKEAEFLEASFRAKAASLHQVLFQFILHLEKKFIRMQCASPTRGKEYV